MNRKTKLLTAILVGGLIFLGGTDASANLLVNGSFEEPSPTGWVGGFGEYSHASEAYYDGPAPSGCGDTYGWNWGLTTMSSASQTVEMPGMGGQYTFGAWLSSWYGDTDYPVVMIEFFDGASGSGGLLGYVEFNGNDVGSIYIVGSANDYGLADPAVAWTQDNWTFYEAADIIPSGTNSAVVTISSNSVSSNGNDAYVDLVSLEIASVGPAWDPDPVDDPAPADTYVPISKVLSWRTGVDPNDVPNPSPLITGHFVYVGTDIAAVEAATPTSHAGVDYYNYQVVTVAERQEYDPEPDMATDATYYWRVDERLYDDANSVAGSIWVFHTTVTLPQINDDTPADLYVWLGEDAVLTVEATDPMGGTLSYQWYYDADDQPGGEQLLTNETDNTLTVTATDEGDKGYYLCKVTNTVGTVSSRKANLAFKKLLAHWPFDGNTDEVTGNITGTAVVGTPSYETGPDGVGQAISLTDAVDVTLAGPTELKYGAYADFSISFWFKIDEYTYTDSVFMSNKGWYSGMNVGWIVSYGYYEPVIKSNISDGSVRRDTDSADYVDDGQWHLFTATFDRDTLTGTYLDGSLKNTNDLSAITGTIDTGNPTKLGRDGLGNYAISVPFAIDELKFTNWPMSAEEVADVWFDVTGQGVCIDRPATDLNGDCQVNIEDLTELAAGWLRCNLIPVTMCP